MSCEDAGLRSRYEKYDMATRQTRLERDGQTGHKRRAWLPGMG
jgi:hypothetical protein